MKKKLPICTFSSSSRSRRIEEVVRKRSDRKHIQFSPPPLIYGHPIKVKCKTREASEVTCAPLGFTRISKWAEENDNEV